MVCKLYINKSFSLCLKVLASFPSSYNYCELQGMREKGMVELDGVCTYDCMCVCKP